MRRTALALVGIAAVVAVLVFLRPPSPSTGIDLKAVASRKDSVAFVDLVHNRHYEVRRKLDTLLSELVVLRAHEGSNRDTLDVQLAWLTENYGAVTGLTEKSTRHSLYCGWSQAQASRRLDVDSAYRRLVWHHRRGRSDPEALPENLFRDSLAAIATAYKTLGDTLTAATVDYAVAESYYNAGQIDSAQTRVLGCLDICRAFDDLERTGICQLLLSRIYSLHKGDYLRSEKSLLLAADCFVRIDDNRWLASTYLNQAYNSSLLFQTDKAIDAYQSAYRAFETYGEARQMDYCLYALGESFYDKGLFDSAAHYARRALDKRLGAAHKDPGRQSDVAYSRSCLGLIAQALGDFDEAHPQYRAAGELFDKCGDSEGAYTNRLRLATLLTSLGYYDRARGLYHTILDSATQFEHGIHAQYGLAVCDYHQGRNEEAADILRRCIHRVETSRALLSVPQARTGMLSDKHGYYDLMVCLAMERFDGTGITSWCDSAFKYMESSRSKTLADMLQPSARTSVSPREDSLIAAISALENRLLLQKSDSVATLEAIRSLEDSLDTERVRNAPVQINAPDELVRNTTSLSVVRDSILTEGDLVLEYTLSEFGCYVMLISREGVEVVPLERQRDEIRAEIDSLVQSIGKYPASPDESEAWRNHSLKIREMLIPEAAIDKSHARHLIISAVDKLHQLPFEALIGPDGRFLIEDYEISYAPSLTVLNMLRKRCLQSPSAPTLFAMGDPAFDDPQVESLEYSRRELECLQQLFGPEHSTILLGDKATETALRETDFHGTTYLHIATHGVCNERRPDMSSLLLAAEKETPGSGSLHAPEIGRMIIPVDLVFLSACRSGSGMSYPGEGVLSLAQPFLTAGAGSVVVSHWNIADQPAVQLVGSFYSLVLSGRKKSEALRQAKMTLLRSERELYRHPYFWAPFVLVGLDN